MKRFLTKFGVALVLLYFGALLLDIIVSRGLLKMEDYRFQDYAAMLKGGMENDVLIIGNSRGKSHFDPSIIDSMLQVSSFCIGAGGYPINVHTLKYDLYREHNRKPRVIIQNVDHMTIRIMEDVRHQHQSEQFFPLVYDRQMRKELPEAGYTWKELWIPMFRFFGYQMVIKNGLLEALSIKHYISNPAYKGHRPESGRWDGTELAKMTRQEIILPAEAKVQFEDFLADCKRDTVEVVLVFSPMYTGALEKYTNLQDVKTYFRKTADRFGFPYLDYTEGEGLEISSDSTNFCVSVHMNPYATKRFTGLLCRDLDSLGVLK